MKKLIFSILALILLIPTLVNADETTCDIDTINSLKEQLKDVTFDLEYVPEGTEVICGWCDETNLHLSSSNVIKLISLNIPENFYIIVNDGDLRYYLDHETTYINLNGGTYNVTYYNYECNQDVIKNHEFMIPYYDSKNVETWFDGTYEKKVVSSSSNKVIINPLLMVMLLVFIIIIILMLFFLKRGSKLK